MLTSPSYALIESLFNQLLGADSESILSIMCHEKYTRSFNTPKDSIEYLGYVVSHGGISADPDKVTAVRDFPRPQSVKQLHSFLGLSSYYRRFIPRFSQVAAPLYALIKKDALFK